MIQKSSCKLSTKANRHFYDMAKIRVTIILLNINIFTIFETLFQELTEILLTIYQRKTKMSGKYLNCLIYV